MKNKITLAVLLAAGNMVAQGQAVTKVYYNSDWKVIKATDTVAFYRIVKLDANNKALDTIRDYYASGELNSKTDGALLIDTLNDKNSKYTGTCMEYYKSGKKKSKTVRDAQGNILLSQGWYDNGDFRFTVPYTDGKKEGTGKWYYSGGNLLSEIPYTNDKRNGTGKWYYKEHGTLYSEVKYVDDLKNGVSKYYYESGELDDETTYSNDTIVGVSKYYYKDGKLQSELPHNKGKLEGTYKSYFENGKPMSTYDYANGSLNGYVILYWGNGKLKRRDKYENGKFVEGRCYDSTGAAIEHFDYYVAGPSEDVFTTVQQMPVFPGNINEYLSKHINYPKKEQKNGIMGTVYISFIVEKDGSISTVKVLRGVTGGQGLDDEAVRVISSMPNWTPGMQNGFAVRVSYNIPIRFVLD